MSEVVFNVVWKVFVLVVNYEKVWLDYFVEVVEFLLKKFGVIDNEVLKLIGNWLFMILEFGCGIGKFIWVMVKLLMELGKKVKVIVSDFL